VSQTRAWMRGFQSHQQRNEATTTPKIDSHKRGLEHSCGSFGTAVWLASPAGKCIILWLREDAARGSSATCRDAAAPAHCTLGSRVCTGPKAVAPASDGALYLVTTCHCTQQEPQHPPLPIRLFSSRSCNKAHSRSRLLPSDIQWHVNQRVRDRCHTSGSALAMCSRRRVMVPKSGRSSIAGLQHSVTRSLSPVGTAFWNLQEEGSTTLHDFGKITCSATRPWPSPAPAADLNGSAGSCCSCLT
jgi:hypothetical protein